MLLQLQYTLSVLPILVNYLIQRIRLVLCLLVGALLFANIIICARILSKIWIRCILSLCKYIVHLLLLLLSTGETRKMTLVESLRDAMDITLSKDSTSSKWYTQGYTLDNIYCTWSVACCILWDEISVQTFKIGFLLLFIHKPGRLQKAETWGKQLYCHDGYFACEFHRNFIPQKFGTVQCPSIAVVRDQCFLMYSLLIITA